MIRAGEFRHFAEVLKQESERTDSGASTITWREIARVPCKIRSVSSNQAVASDQVKQTTGYEVTIRWLTGLDATHRMRIDNFIPGGPIVFRISGIRDPDGKREMLIVNAVQIDKSAN